MLLILLADKGAGKTWLIQNTFLPAGWVSGEGHTMKWIEKQLNAGKRVVLGATGNPIAYELYFPNFHTQYWCLQFRENPQNAPYRTDPT
jgi:hypothetical protein